MDATTPTGDERAAGPGAAGEPAGIPRDLVVLLAVATGLAVANLYYAQPLLHAIAEAFHTGSGTAGLVVTASQVGYAVGLALLVPVGDIVVRRRLVPAVLLVVTAAMAASAVAPGIGFLAGAAVVLGVASCAAQILVPFAAALAGEANRGRVVGTVMSGLLTGILLARTLSGLVAEVAGWRSVFVFGAVVSLLLAAVLYRRLPGESARPAMSYPSLLLSTVRLFRSEPGLRRRAGLGALGMAAFSAFWTTLAFQLAKPPFDYSEVIIGLFGLVGAAGALCATYAGRFADRGWTTAATAVFAASIAVSFPLLYLARHSLAWLIVGIVVLDVGVQGLQVTNQSIIYRLAPRAGSRATSSYMVTYFAGGAAGSAAASALYASAGWGGVCLLGTAIGVAALVGWAADTVRPARPAGAAGPVAVATPDPAPVAAAPPRR